MAFPNALPDIRFVDGMPVLASRIEVEPKDRLRIDVELSPMALPETRTAVTWLQDNLVIRNNLHLESLQIVGAANLIRLVLRSQVTPRDGRISYVPFGPSATPVPGDHIVLMSQRTVFVSPTLDGHYLQAEVRGLIREHLLHEIDECLVFDGRLPFDPHASDND